MKLKETLFKGCFEILLPRYNDARGFFSKPFHLSTFKLMGLEVYFPEDFYSVSKLGVIRGFHFQIPPYDLVKIVYCTSGRILDVVVDLRPNSPTYGHHFTLELSPELSNAIYIPKGFAHGFCALSNNAIVNYKVSTEHSPEHERGIRWDSLGVDWPIIHPILSQRDASFPPFSPDSYFFSKDQ